jgi:hypothetical protein
MLDSISSDMVSISLAIKLNSYTGYKFDSETKERISDIYTNIFISMIKEGKWVKMPYLFGKAALNMNYYKTAISLKNRLIGFRKA